MLAISYDHLRLARCDHEGGRRRIPLPGLRSGATIHPQLRAEIARMRAANVSLSQLLGEMRGYLNPQGVEMIIRAAYMIALSDWEFHETERALLWEIAQGLGMMPAHFKGLMSELMNDRLPAAPPPIPGAN